MRERNLGAQQAEDVAAHLGRLARRQRLHQRHLHQLRRMLRHAGFARPPWLHLLGHVDGRRRSGPVRSGAALGAEPARRHPAPVVDRLGGELSAAVLAGEVLPGAPSVGRAGYPRIGAAVLAALAARRFHFCFASFAPRGGGYSTGSPAGRPPPPGESAPTEPNRAIDILPADHPHVVPAITKQAGGRTTRGRPTNSGQVITNNRSEIPKGKLMDREVDLTKIAATSRVTSSGGSLCPLTSAASPARTSWPDSTQHQPGGICHSHRRGEEPERLRVCRHHRRLRHRVPQGRRPRQPHHRRPRCQRGARGGRLHLPDWGPVLRSHQRT